MAEEIGSILNSSELSKALWETLPPQITGSFDFLLSIAKIAGILVLIYLAFLIVQAIFKIRQVNSIKSIEQNVAEINKKLDLVLAKKKKS